MRVLLSATGGIGRGVGRWFGFRGGPWFGTGRDRLLSGYNFLSPEARRQMKGTPTRRIPVARVGVGRL